MFLPVSSNEQLVVQGNNASLYVRPLLFASGQMLGLAPLASEYTFFVTVLPAGGYFGKGQRGRREGTQRKIVIAMHLIPCVSKSVVVQYTRDV